MAAVIDMREISYSNNQLMATVDLYAAVARPWCSTASGDSISHAIVWQSTGKRKQQSTGGASGSKVAGRGDCSKAVTGSRNEATINR